MEIISVLKDMVQELFKINKIIYKELTGNQDGFLFEDADVLKYEFDAI
jgi:hypothetical protein